MNRRDFEKKMSEYGYQKGGTKEACLKAEEVLQNIVSSYIELIAPRSAVNMSEFVDAVNVLIAATKPKEDYVPTICRCENDCAYLYSQCPGRKEYVISEDSKTLCPYYCIEDK